MALHENVHFFKPVILLNKLYPWKIQKENDHLPVLF